LRDLTKTLMTPRAAAADALAQSRRGADGQGLTAFVFGPERSGMTNDDLATADCLVQIPTNPSFSSLNLAMSVTVLASEW
jgi:tRNA/rRNA methyltransferase